MKILKAADLFDELEPEKAKEVEQFKVERSTQLEKIIEGYERILSHKFQTPMPENMYPIVRKALPAQYTAQDITAFSLLAHQYQTRKNESFGHTIGLYVSALINKCASRNITIYSTNLEMEAVDNFCFRNKKKQVIIRGPGGEGIGSDMTGGKIMVQGSVGMYAGHGMTSGVIHVKGSCGKNLGTQMSGGKIIIEGDAEDYIGEHSLGGEMYIGGRYENISDSCGAAVYTKKNGRWTRVWNGGAHE